MSLTLTFQIQRLIHALKIAGTNKKSNKEVILRFRSSQFFLSINGCVASSVVFLVASGVILPHWYVILSLLSIEVVAGSFAIIVLALTMNKTNKNRAKEQEKIRENLQPMIFDIDPKT